MAEIHLESLRGDRYWRLSIANGIGNVLDDEALRALTDVFRRARQTAALRAIVIEGAGANFSYGASVHEHAPPHVAQILQRMGEMAFALLESDVVIVAAVRGRCLGGGLELAALCHRIVCSADATFGQPEIALGVFAPIASIVLSERIGRGHAEEMCLTGGAITAARAEAIGLVQEVHSDPSAAAQLWAEQSLARLSASGLRHANRAIRMALVTRLRQELPILEAQYLQELMATQDAAEGVAAFIEKRAAVWKDA